MDISDNLLPFFAGVLDAITTDIPCRIFAAKAHYAAGDDTKDF